MSTPVNNATVGKFFIDERGDLWEHISYCANPTATFRRVGETLVAPGACPTRMTAAVGAPLISQLRLLVPEGNA